VPFELLTKINSPAANSAILRLLTIHETEDQALAWVQNAGLDISDFDSDGKFFYLSNLLILGRWEELVAEVANITKDDQTRSPVLLHPLAMASVIQAVPVEARSTAISQVPFEATQFRLSDSPHAMEGRRQAVEYFDALSDFGIAAGVMGRSNPASDYALWLRLRDPLSRQNALEVLRESMRDDSQSLRRVNLALQFDIKLDIGAIERRIDRTLALGSDGTGDAAFARFALALAQDTPQAVADYIAKHRLQLYKHLNKVGVLVVEIEMLARAKLIDRAEQRLSEEASSGLGEQEQEHLRRVIAEARGADPSAERKSIYEISGSLADLVNLVSVLARADAWDDILPYAEKLFAITQSLEDACRFAKCLSELERYSDLMRFLTENAAFVEQSPFLRTMLAWSLYREGRFGEAVILLRAISSGRDNADDRILEVNLCIASGKWEDLIEFTNGEWRNRDRRTANELLHAGRLAHLSGGPHSRELITCAAKKAPDDPTFWPKLIFKQ